MPIEIGIDPVARKRRLDDAINAERDRRIRATFAFRGHGFDFDEVSKANIAGAATLAGFAMAAGAVPGDLHWSGAAEPFSWLAADNTRVPMDAATAFAFGQAAAEHVRAHVFAARALKDAAVLPADWADNRHWPDPRVGTPRTVTPA
jgi:hypothetical protein